LYPEFVVASVGFATGVDAVVGEVTVVVVLIVVVDDTGARTDAETVR
jgi:hypothetical protein